MYLGIFQAPSASSDTALKSPANIACKGPPYSHSVRYIYLMKYNYIMRSSPTWNWEIGIKICSKTR